MISHKHKFAIGIPTINQADLLNEALEKYFQDFANTKIFILDNGNQEIKKRNKKFKIIRTKENYGVAKSWNTLCDRIFKQHTHALILNDDIYLGKTESEINALISAHQDVLIEPPFKYRWSSFILPKKYFTEQRFDENFYPAYLEDDDYKYRLNLTGKKIINNENLSAKTYRKSQSVKSSEEEYIQNAFYKNKKYYIEKWGGLPNIKNRGPQWAGEKYKTPFNK